MSEIPDQWRIEDLINEPQEAAGKGIYCRKEVEDACNVES